MVLKQLDIKKQNEQNEKKPCWPSILNSYLKFNLKGFIYWNVEPKTIELVGENIEEKLVIVG